MASIGFSAGDITSGITLVKDLIIALQDSRGSFKDYLDLISELRSLEAALVDIKNLRFSPQQYRQQIVLGDAVSRCRVIEQVSATSSAKWVAVSLA